MICPCGVCAVQTIATVGQVELKAEITLYRPNIPCKQYLISGDLINKPSQERSLLTINKHGSDCVGLPHCTTFSAISNEFTDYSQSWIYSSNIPPVLVTNILRRYPALRIQQLVGDYCRVEARANIGENNWVERLEEAMGSTNMTERFP